MKNNLISLVLIFFWFSPWLFAQGVGINTDGTAPDNSAILDVKSTDKGILVPRLHLVNVNNPSPVSSPATGLLVYNTNASVVGGSGTGFYYWNGSQWVRLDISNGDWRLVGNAGTNPANNFLGTTDNVDLVIRTNNNERIRVAAGGNVGIGTNSPQRVLHIERAGDATIRLRDPNDPAGDFWELQSDAFNPNSFGIVRYVGSVAQASSSVVVTSAGNVGLGITTPSERLHVAGNLRLDNAFMPGNNAGVAGALLRSNGAGTAPSWLAPGSNGDILTISSGAPAWSNGNGLFWRLVGNAGTNPTNNFLGTTDNVDLVFRTNNTERVRITAAGNVGIGTATPDRPLTIVNSSEWNIVSRSANTTTTARNHLLLQRSNGGAAVPAGFTLGGIAMGGYDGSNFSFGWNGGAEITAITSQAWTATNRGTHLVFNTSADNSASAVERMRITSNGNVGIGTASPSYRLDVFGGNGTYMAISGDLPVNGSQGLVGVVWRNTAEGGSYVAYLADPDGGFGVNPRSWELWEYPSSAPGSCCRPRFRVISSHGLNPPTEVVISSEGNVGIATTSPISAKLHVAESVVSPVADVTGFPANSWGAGIYYFDPSPIPNDKILYGVAGRVKEFGVTNTGGHRIGVHGALVNNAENNWIVSGSLAQQWSHIVNRVVGVLGHVRSIPPGYNAYTGFFTSDGPSMSQQAPFVINYSFTGIGEVQPAVQLHVRKTWNMGSGNGGNNNNPTTAIITAGSDGSTYLNDWPNTWGGGLATWDVCGSSTFFTSYVTRSDKSFKKDISSLEYDKIKSLFMELKPVSYRFNEDVIQVDDNNRLRYGFIANEVENIFPDLVVNAGMPQEVRRGLEYDGFIPLLVTMVQNLQKEVDNLKRQLEEKNRN